MKLKIVNNNADFELPEKPLTVRDDREIITFMSKQDKELTSNVKTIIEFTETVYRVLLKVDKNITRELIEDNLTTEEIGVLYALFRSRYNVMCDCPFCGKQFPYNKIFEKKDQVADKNFRQTPVNPDTTVMS